MIHISGLTIAQVKLLDILWSIESTEDLERFISSFGERMQRECWTLIELVKAASFDQINDIDEDIVDLITKIKNS